MYPNIPAKTTLWVKRKPLFKCEKITRGEIIVFYQKKDGKIYDYIWRVIGLPGDEIRIEGSSVYINDQLLEQEKFKETADQIIFFEKCLSSEYMVAYDKNPKSTKRIDLDLIVPDEHFFLLGDNRDNAMDSRFNGFVNFINVIGIKM
jgi:signal peptidase I